jgi:uncharacterized membrane protein
MGCVQEAPCLFIAGCGLLLLMNVFLNRLIWQLLQKQRLPQLQVSFVCCLFFEISCRPQTTAMTNLMYMSMCTTCVYMCVVLCSNVVDYTATAVTGADFSKTGGGLIAIIADEVPTIDIDTPLSNIHSLSPSLSQCQMSGTKLSCGLVVCNDQPTSSGYCHRFLISWYWSTVILASPFGDNLI